MVHVNNLALVYFKIAPPFFSLSEERSYCFNVSKQLC